MSLSVKGISPSNASLAKIDDPVLRRGEIQGDVLVGLQKDEEIFLFFKINQVSNFKKKFKAEVLDRITTTSSVLAREIQVQAFAKQGHLHRLPFVGVNVGFTHAGLVALLGASKCTAMDASFMAGAAVSAAKLSDPVKADGSPDWNPDFAAATIHGVFLVAGPKKEDGKATSLAEDEARRIERVCGPAMTVVFRQTGKLRPQRGHEHFGFLDGVSNPGVRGLTPRQNPLDENQGVPGQDLLWPGAFVFGYPGQDPAKPFEEPGPAPSMGQPWMRDGSYMVFRRLNQRVPEFRSFLDSQAVVHGTDPALIGARMVGRWQSGAPVMMAPLQDDPALGADPLRNNDFEYSQDKAQRRCPYAGHIRKTYPRDDLEDPNTIGLPNPEGFVQSRRIMRAGIPFGEEVSDSEAETGVTAQERGLVFVCYQTSIIDQFEFIQESWSNAPDFIFGKTRPSGGGPVTPGHDPIIGQAKGPRQMDEILPNYPVGNTRSTLDMPDPFVVLSAAAYFFMPSISMMRTF